MDAMMSPIDMQQSLSAALGNKATLAAQTLTNASESKIDDKTMRGIKKAAKDFEAVFISQMLNHMFAGVKVDENFGGGQGEEMFRSMMLDEYGKMIADTGQLGIADSMMADMIKMQEGVQL